MFVVFLLGHLNFWIENKMEKIILNENSEIDSFLVKNLKAAFVFNQIEDSSFPELVKFTR